MKTIKEFLYLNLSDQVGFLLPIGAIITFFTVAFIIASFYLYYYKLATSTLYKRLLRYDATSEEKARTLAELKIDRVRRIAFAIKGGGEISRIIKFAGEEKLSYEDYVKKTKSKGFKEEKKDYKTARLYLNPEMIDRAKTRASENITIVKPIIATAILLVVFTVLVIALPSLISLID